MNTERSVIASIVFLGLGLGLIFAYCHDSTVTMGAAYPIAGASLQVVINTNGLPAIAGIILTALGVLFFFAALVFAVLKMISQRTVAQPRKSSFS